MSLKRYDRIRAALAALALFGSLAATAATLAPMIRPATVHASAAVATPTPTPTATITSTPKATATPPPTPTATATSKPKATATARLALRGRVAPFHGPRWYQHIFVLVLENHSYEDIIGNRLAPHLNALARHYGLATHYYAVAHPSEPNYVSLIGGSFFGNRNDNPYQPVGRRVNHPIRALSLADQLEASGLTWKSYQQSLPRAGYLGLYYPTSRRPLYVFRHNPFLAFADVQHNAAEWRKIVPDTQLASDVRRGQVPAFGFIAPDLCHDMHGQWPMCPSAQTLGDAQSLIRQGDAYVGSIVHLITSARFWSKGNNAIVITWDENDYSSWHKGVSGCCGAAPGGGHVAAIVVTSHGRHGVHDTTWYNHYSLLRTIQVAFHLGCLQNTCHTDQVRVMRALFVAAGVKAVKTHRRR